MCTWVKINAINFIGGDTTHRASLVYIYELDLVEAGGTEGALSFYFPPRFINPGNIVAW